jgi:hypothetical protein
MDEAKGRLADRPGAWVDLGLTLPIFLLYHLTVVFLGVQNATDLVTGTLLGVSHGDKSTYLLATLAIGVVFAGTFALLGRGQAFHPRKFLQIAVEGVVYAVVMRLVAAFVVGRVFMGPIKDEGRFVGFVMSLGAGFYEELTFRVILFGLGAKILVWLFAREKVELTGTAALVAGATSRTRKSTLGSWFVMLAWAVVCALIFSGVHYVGALGDSFQISSFAFRAILGLVLTLIYVTRGFAAAVWTHAVYDVWVLVFH